MDLLHLAQMIKQLKFGKFTILNKINNKTLINNILELK